jgi:hypothetical protein
VHDIEEDRGYTLSFGLSTSALTSFLPLSDAAKLSPRALEIGQVILTRITKLHANERTCSVAVESADIAATTTDSISSITSVLPGQLVSVLVTAALPSGLNVKLHGYFDGTIDSFHLPAFANPEDKIEDAYKVGQKLKARVLWDSISSTPKKFALSAAEHVVALSEGSEEEKKWEVGRKGRFEVRAADDEWGLTGVLYGEGEESSSSAFVHVRFSSSLSASFVLSLTSPRSLPSLLSLLLTVADLPHHRRPPQHYPQERSLEGRHEALGSCCRLLGGRRARSALAAAECPGAGFLEGSGCSGWTGG